MIRVLRRFEDAGAMPVVFKGAALAHTHYEESWRRPRYDADVLINPAQREPVFAILDVLGYTRPPFISGELVMYQAPFERTDHLGVDHALDLHWRIANPQVVSQVLTHDELVAGSVTVNVQGHPMRVPSDVDALLLACVHRAAHHPNFEKPIWVRDIHLLAMALEPSEWQMFVEQATRRSVRAGSSQVAHTSRSVKALQRAQSRIAPRSSATACDSRSASARVPFSRWNAIRCADLGPIPGSRWSSSMRRASGAG